MIRWKTRWLSFYLGRHAQSRKTLSFQKCFESFLVCPLDCKICQCIRSVVVAPAHSDIGMQLRVKVANGLERREFQHQRLPVNTMLQILHRYYKRN